MLLVSKFPKGQGCFSPSVPRIETPLRSRIPTPTALTATPRCTSGSVTAHTSVSEHPWHGWKPTPSSRNSSTAYRGSSCLVIRHGRPTVRCAGPPGSQFDSSPRDAHFLRVACPRSHAAVLLSWLSMAMTGAFLTCASSPRSASTHFAELAWRLPGPAPEGVREVRQVAVAEIDGDLTDRQGVVEQSDDGPLA